jgi:integrase
MTRRPGIGYWHAHEGRHTAVSIMSSNGVPIQEIRDAVGHKSTHVTETVYRHVIVHAIRTALQSWTTSSPTTRTTRSSTRPVYSRGKTT